jgi:hypothetical protein
MRYEADPEWVYVALASLTTPPDREPDHHYSFEERVAWLHFRDELPKCRAKSNEPAA